MNERQRFRIYLRIKLGSRKYQQFLCKIQNKQQVALIAVWLGKPKRTVYDWIKRIV